MENAHSKIILVRHGETEWNCSNRLQGHKDSPLTSRGRKQAVELRQALAKTEIDAAYASPLHRTLETIAILLDGRSIVPTLCDGLKEIALGPWEGKKREETRLSHPQQYEDFWFRPQQFSLAGAETFQRLQDRVVAELRSISDRHPNQTVLVVTHWIAIKTALAYFTSTPLSDLSSISDPANGEFITLYRQGDRFRVENSC